MGWISAFSKYLGACLKPLIRNDWGSLKNIKGKIRFKNKKIDGEEVEGILSLKSWLKLVNLGSLLQFVGWADVQHRG